MTSQQFMLVRADEDRFDTKEAFAADPELLIGSQAGTSGFYTAVYDILDGDEANPRIKLFENFGASVQALLAGDVDMVLVDAASGPRLHRRQPDKLKIVGDAIKSEEFGFIFQQGSDLVAPFNAAIATMKEDGFTSYLDNKWFFLYDPTQVSEACRMSAGDRSANAQRSHVVPGTHASPHKGVLYDHHLHRLHRAHPDRQVWRRAQGCLAGRPGRACDEGRGGSARASSPANSISISLATSSSMGTANWCRAMRPSRPGIPAQVDGYAVDMLCSSGMMSTMNADKAIRAGEASLVLAGGIESMSQAGFVLSHRARWGYKLLIGDSREHLQDVLLADGLTDPMTGELMGEETERLCAEYGITRTELDEVAYLSNTRAAAATAAGKFQAEIAPIEVQEKRKSVARGQR